MANTEVNVNTLAKVLGIAVNGVANTALTVAPKKELVKAPQEDKLDNDAEHARQTVYDTIQKSNEAIDQLMEIARESMHPRAFEVLATMLKDNSDAALKLLQVHASKVKITQANGSGNTVMVPSGNTNIGQAVFVGTTSDLLTMIRKTQADADQRTIDSEALDITDK